MSKKIKLIISFIGLLVNWHMGILNAQSLSPQVIASAGGYQSNATGSLSFTIGETNTQTLASATHMLTQGFQQPYKLTLNVKAFLQGYYAANGIMESVLNHYGIICPTVYTDTITIELHDNSPGYALSSSSQAILHSNGMVYGEFPLSEIGSSKYVVIKHRSSLETWSATPVTVTPITEYNFSTAASQAFGDNQLEVSSGVFAMYTGDVNQDGFIDSFDFPALDTDIFNGLSATYVNTDINGDGFVDSFDFPMFDVNNSNGIRTLSPTP